MKFTSVLLCIAMLFGFAAPSFAEADNADNELEKVVLEVKARLNIGDYEDFSSRITTQDDKKTYWLYWENSEKDYASVSVVFSDEIISDYNYTYDSIRYNENRFPSVSYDDALAAAEEFIKNANPDIYESIEIIPNKSTKIGDAFYNFNLARKENGITVAENGGNISVSKTTNEVTYFSIDYEPDVEFTSLENVILPEEAELKYAEKLPFELQYSCYYNYKNKEIKVFPQYNCVNSVVLNAVTGEIYKILPDGLNALKENSALSGGSGYASDEVSISESERIELEKISGLITADKAEEAVRSNTAVSMNQNLKLQNISLERNYMDNELYTYNLFFRNNDEYLRAELDAVTGQILSFYKNGDYSVKNQNTETEKHAAEEMLKVLEAEKYAELRLSEETKLGRVCYYRIINGIKVDTDGVYFEFDGTDNLISYSFNKTNIKEIPSIDEVMTSKEAFDSAKKQFDFELIYFVDNKKGYPVYCFTETDRIAQFDLNPFTGIRIDYKGDEYNSENIIYYTDIDNHYAKDKLLKLAEYGIGFSENKLEPSKLITTEEFEVLLSKVFINKEKSSGENSPLTRENAAVLLTNKIGCTEYLKYDEMFIAPFDDVSDNKGSISYLKAIGVISGDGNGSFHPKDTITRSEALIMIYNYLNRQENI